MILGSNVHLATYTVQRTDRCFQGTWH